ncbi:MAG TPA: TonB family protein [Kofleriaceae bacterium]|nr:TonB family protein [Kofleriaceae bacterium]
MKNIIAVSILVSACATTGRSLPVESSGTGIGPTFNGQLAQSTDEAKPWFPMLASDAVLPSVAHRQVELSTDRDRYTFAVRLCVAPDGKVSKVDITRPSESSELDRAAMHDIAQWQFEAFSAPQTVRVCKQLDLAYEPQSEKSHIAIPLVRTSQP